MKRFASYIILVVLFLGHIPAGYAAGSSSAAKGGIGMRELADSLNQYTRFSTLWAPAVRVKQLRINGNTITVRTNTTLSGVAFTPAQLQEIRKNVSLWVLGHKKGKVSIYSGDYELGSLLTDRVHPRKVHYPSSSCDDYTYSTTEGKTILRPVQNAKKEDAYLWEEYAEGLSGKIIALWPSHGTYYNADKDSWIWQRATMWTTVEDLYTIEYARLVAQMLENAGAIVLQPRVRTDGYNLRRIDNGKGGFVWRLVKDSIGYEIGRSGMPRWTEAAKYWLQEAGYPDTIWNMYDGTNDYKADLQCRGLWVNYLSGGSDNNPKQQGLGIPVDVCIALHTDGLSEQNDSTIIGTLAIYTDHDDERNKVFPNGITRQINRDLADYVQTQVVEDIRQTIAPEWTRRQLNNANYCESRYPLVPSVLLEILSHKNMADMRYGLDPQFRHIAARAIYKGLLRYLHSQDGNKTVVQPLPVRNCALRFAHTANTIGAETEDIIFSWEKTIDPIEPTATPTHYLVYTRKDKGEWTVKETSRTRLSFAAQRGVAYDMYVVAVNNGGVSMPSETLSMYLSQDTQAPLGLIINHFNQTYGPQWFADSTYAGIVPDTYPVENHMTMAYIGQQHNYTRSEDWKDDDNCGWGMCYRDRQGFVTIGNTFDYQTMHGEVLHRLGCSYLSANATALQQIDTTYDFIDIICGKERATDTTDVLSSVLQPSLQQYLQHGGKLLISGSYMGSGMQRNGAKQFAETCLHYQYHAPRATRSGIIHTCLPDSGIYRIAMQPNSLQLFAEAPEGLRPYGNGAVRIATYADMRVGAGVAWRDPLSDARTLVWGFPLEALTDFRTLYTRSIQWLIDSKDNAY